MKRFSKVFIRAISPSAWDLLREFKMTFFDTYAQKSYSQEGEDMILRRVLSEKKKGFYVDVGAHHPIRFSNTFFFYKSGWSGINIDAMPDSMALFRKIRPRDINIQAAVGRNRCEMTFFMFNEPALNTFDQALAESRVNKTYQIIDKRMIVARALREILNEHLPAGQTVDFLTVDVEGLELDVLQSNDWDRFRPEYVVVECFGRNVNELLHTEVYQFLIEQDYELLAKTPNTAIYRSDSDRRTLYG